MDNPGIEKNGRFGLTDYPTIRTFNIWRQNYQLFKVALIIK